MKIVLFLNNDIHCATIIEELLPQLKLHKIKIILSHEIGNASNLPVLLSDLKKHEKFADNWQKKFGFESQTYQDINEKNSLDDLKKFAPDLFISIRFGQIFRQPLIDIAKFGVLNLHSGILPKYRGILATFWSILHGETEIGLTLHHITNHEIDKGDIISSYTTKIDFNSSLFDNIHNLYKSRSYLISDAIEKISRGEELDKKPQAKLGKGRYFSYPKTDDIEKFLQLKIPVI
jgi:methionyl-tRNA formyltransferase